MLSGTALGHAWFVMRLWSSDHGVGYIGIRVMSFVLGLCKVKGGFSQGQPDSFKLWVVIPMLGHKIQARQLWSKDDPFRWGGGQGTTSMQCPFKTP